MTGQRTDVVIVGAGPAGLALAIGLADRGVDFIILDSLAEAQNTSRAAVIHAATLATLDRLGVADRLVAQGIKVPNFRIRDRDRVLIHADFSKLRAATPFALMIPQDETEAILIERLESLGHSVRRPALVTGIETVGEDGLVRYEAEGRAETIRCRYIVGPMARGALSGRARGSDFPARPTAPSCSPTSECATRSACSFPAKACSSSLRCRTIATGSSPRPPRPRASLRWRISSASSTLAAPLRAPRSARCYGAPASRFTTSSRTVFSRVQSSFSATPRTSIARRADRA